MINIIISVKFFSCRGTAIFLLVSNRNLASYSLVMFFSALTIETVAGVIIFDLQVSL